MFVLVFQSESLKSLKRNGQPQKQAVGSNHIRLESNIWYLYVFKVMCMSFGVWEITRKKTEI